MQIYKGEIKLFCFYPLTTHPNGQPSSPMAEKERDIVDENATEVTAGSLTQKAKLTRMMKPQTAVGAADQIRKAKMKVDQKPRKSRQT